jgi:hypothetical protein
MADMRFADVMQQERERLHKEREHIFNQKHELESKLTDINRELSAIDAYEAAKTGKALTPARQTRGPRRQQSRRGSRREALMQVIKANPSGLRSKAAPRGRSSFKMMSRVRPHRYKARRRNAVGSMEWRTTARDRAASSTFPSTPFSEVAFLGGCGHASILRTVFLLRPVFRDTPRRDAPFSRIRRRT